uniref:C2H2-type domain-containing protein n=1 Tax=Romanomermis culicivorax TaxID=13658 RepID=A0A915IMQ5_ROMCU
MTALPKSGSHVQRRSNSKRRAVASRSARRGCRNLRSTVPVCRNLRSTGKSKMNSTDSPTDELLEHDSLFNCDQSCILKGNSYIDCCPASKYKTPVRKACTICGVWITDTTDWMKHHFSPRHLKSICYLSSFRQKCKENQDNEGVVIPPANISTIIDSISYEQELFQMCGGSTFICAVCGSGVYDVIEHLKSLKHNESYLNVRYPDCVTKIKEECLTPTGVDWNQYEKRILTHLSENQPKADTPLTIFALKDDSEFNDWIWKCMMAFSTFTQIQNIPICIPELLSDIIPDDIQSIMTDDDNVLYNNDRCTLCRTKVFCSDSFIDHCKSELHVNKKKLFKFLKDSGKYHIVTSRSNEQSTIESLKDPFLGCETIIELTDSNDGQKAWCCAMCLVINGNVKKIGEHLCSAKHILNYLNLNYVDLEVCTSSIDKKLEELKHHASEIMKNSNPGRIQVAQLIDASVADVFDSLGEKLETVSSDRAVTNGNCIELSDDLIFIENGIKLLFSDKKEDLFWCENCNNYVLINKNKDDAKRLWNDHVTSANHLKIKEMKPKLIFDMKNFVDEKPSNIIMEELLRPGICIIGGNYMVERKIKNDDGQLINDIACLLCFELMPLEKFADHIHSRSHIKQFLHKEEPKLMRQILTEPGREDEVIENYFKQRPIRKGVRVYNPTKSEYLTNEYERLKKQIAEKERILEEKRREKAEEARLEELRRKSKDNDEKKLIEQRRTAELERIEKIKREEEERQARVLQNIRRMKERQETEQKYLLEQKRLHQRLQEERQKKKDEEKKKLEERRILDLMKKEKEALAKKEEDDKQSKKNAAVVAASRSFYQQAYNPEQLSKDQKIDNALKNSALLPIRPPLNAYIHPISVTCPEPLIGLELIYEFECSDDSFEPGYFCSLCTIKCLAKEIIKHEKAYKPLYGNIMKFYKENESSRNAAAIKQYAARVERQGGRKRIENRLSTKVPSSYLFTKKPSLFCTRLTILRELN